MPRTNSISLPPKPTLEFEQRLWGEGYRIIAGLDEAGRGAWAGPVYAAAVVLPNDLRICDLLSGVRDSKRMTPRQRDRWRGCIQSAAIAWSVASATNEEIDRMGILPATCLAMRRALDELRNQPNHLLVDYIQIPDCTCPQLSLPYGDCRSLSIAAASVLAKTGRDAWMVQMDVDYPGYGFAKHKGYGTWQHRQALMCQGPLPIHRKSFKPIRDMDCS